ncbi:MAG: EAL domain-containing protein [Acidovorax sp.]
MTQDPSPPVAAAAGDPGPLPCTTNHHSIIYEALPSPAGLSRMSDGMVLDMNPAGAAMLGLPREQVVGRTLRELGIWGPGERELMVQALRDGNGSAQGLPITVVQAGRTLAGVVSVRQIDLDGLPCLVFAFQDMTHEHYARNELKVANSLLNEASRMVQMGVWQDIPGTGVIHWSDVCRELHGLAPDAPLPADYVQTCVAPEWRDRLIELRAGSVRDQVPFSLDMEIIRVDDGRRRWVRARGEPVVQNGLVSHWHGVIIDIDDSYRAFEQLRTSEKRLAKLFDSLPFPLGYISAEDSRYIDVNPAWEQVTGYTRAEALGRNAVELGLYSQETCERLLAALHVNGGLLGDEAELITRGGERHTVIQTMSQIEVRGQGCWLFSLHDITDRKRAEEQVRERQELLSLSISAASLGLWDCHLEPSKHYITGDTRWRDMLAMPEGAVSLADWVQRCTEEERAPMRQEMQRHLGNPGSPFDVTIRSPFEQGGTRWIRCLGKVVSWSAAGEPTRMLGLSMDVTRLREQEAQLERMAHYDPLTGLPNRVTLEQRLRQAMARCDSLGQRLVVAYLDLDNFKPVNDRFGHAAGDRLLVQLSERLTRSLRQGDCVARLGGDEFVILLPGLDGGALCEERLNALLHDISRPYDLNREHARATVTASVGYTVYPDDPADADTLLRHADQAMYAAKQAGRNRLHAFNAAQEQAREQLYSQRARLTRAIDAGELALYLQPIVDMHDGRIAGAEALVRWLHPERGLLAPGAFLHLLEDHADMHLRFGTWVVDTALGLAGSLMQSGLHLPISVNIAPEHLHQPGFAQWMRQRLALHPGVPPARLSLELTESAALYDTEHAARELAELRGLGMGIAFDDFGTGYSSLAYLRHLPLDQLKIDRSFVNGMGQDTNDRAIVQGVIGLAQSFGCGIVAEGVETAAQGRMLLGMGCRLGQGYGIARPMPAADFPAWAAAWHMPGEWRPEPEPAP